MKRSNGNLLRKLGILAALISLALAVVSCGDSDPASPPAANRSPGIPSLDTTAGTPADAAVDAPLTVTLHWTCTDPDNDVLIYTVHWGNSDTPPVVSSDQAETSYGPISLANSTTFYWQIMAKDPDGETTTSPVWSFTTLTAATETISDPNTPTGPTTGETGEDLLFSASGSVSNLGHTVEYRLDWGDGTTSDWGANQDVAHSWAVAGAYDVTATARCITHPGVDSASSPARTVTITAAAVETISTPDAPVGPVSGEMLETLHYEMTGAVSSFGSNLQIQFDWDDGYTPQWTSAASADKSWLAAGTYDVRVQARSADDLGILSEWSTATTVVITTPAETITAPNMSGTSDDIAAVGDDAWVSCSHASSNLGHALEYRFDLGDGTLTAWSADFFGNFSWSTAGTYTLRAQARCAEHTDVVSDWTPAGYTEEIVISDTAETISKPVIQDHGVALINEGTTFSVSASSNLGHPLDYMFDWGDGTTLTWNPNYAVAHTYTALGEYSLRVKARCRTHTDIESEWSDVYIVHVVETVSQPTLTGPDTGTEEMPSTYTVGGSTSNLGHDLEYRLFISSSRYDTVGTPQEWTTADNLVYTFPVSPATARTYYVRVQARCIEHLTASILSLPVETVVHDQ